MAGVLILEPIFEADLQDEQYAYRAKRNAHDAVREVHWWLNRGLKEVVDADLSGYFDTIPHPQLLKSLARRSFIQQSLNVAGDFGLALKRGILLA